MLNQFRFKSIPTKSNDRPQRPVFSSFGWQGRAKPAVERPVPRLYAEERLRQAKLSFNLALLMTGASSLIGLAGAGLLLLGKVQAGSMTAAGGVLTSLRYFQLAKEANDRLDQLLKPVGEKQA